MAWTDDESAIWRKVYRATKGDANAASAAVQKAIDKKAIDKKARIAKRAKIAKRVKTAVKEYRAKKAAKRAYKKATF